MCDWEHFEKVEDELRKVIVTWNVTRIRDALVRGSGPDHNLFSVKECKCEGCVLPAPMIAACEDMLKRLAAKVRLVEPICRKGGITIDYDNCSVEIKKTISFANRKPPDTSAEINPGAMSEALEVMGDLAVVLNAFLEPMVIEGHTGGEDPPEYWGELARNRAQLLVDFLV